MTDTDQPQVLLVGDLHGNPVALNEAFIKAVKSEAIAIIQLGDYGFGWSRDDTEDGEDDFSYLTGAMVEKTGIPFYWLDGNHENFDWLYSLPLNDEGYRPIVPGVTHLPRGSTIQFGNTKFLIFGGAYSVDRGHRLLGRSYWEQETCTDEEVEKASATGFAHVFLSHDAPYGVQTEPEMDWLGKMFGYSAVVHSVENQNQVRRVLDACGAQKAFHGHIHRTYERVIHDTGCVVRALSDELEPGSTYLLSV